MPIHDRVREHATRNPSKIAYKCGDERRTYAEVIEGADGIAAYLASVSSGRRTASLLPGLRSVIVLDVGAHVRFPELFLGTTQVGTACAIIDAHMPERQVLTILEKLEPDLIVTRSAQSIVGKAAAMLGRQILCVENLDNAIASAGNSSSPPSSCADETFLVSFTSGTTSEPKAYSRSRATWEKSLARGYEHFELQSAPTTTCPSSFAYGLSLYAFCEVLHAGGTFIGIEEWDAAATGRILREHAVERLVAVPTMITALAGLDEDGPYVEMRKVITAGAKLNVQHVADIRRMFPDAEIREYYGASELGFVTTARIHPVDQGAPIETVGSAFPGLAISVVDEKGEALPSGTPGTIYVESDLVCDGYLWGDDGKAFRTDASGATVGDFGILSEEGFLTVLGRQGGMIISGGLNIYPSEVEAELKSIPEIDEAIVLGVPDAYLGSKVVAVVSGEGLDVGKIIRQVGNTMPRYKIPREFFVTGTWPQTSNGKVARGEVARMLREGQYETIQVPT